MENETSVQVGPEAGQSTASPPRGKEYNKLACLHVLRFFLAFGIILWHCGFGVAENYEAHPILFSFRTLTIYGGNQAFMLISGMMFYLAYYRKLTEERLSAKEFLKKRAVRIYPMVIVSVLVSYLLSLIARFTYSPDENIRLIPLVEDMFFFGTRLFGGAYGTYNGPIWFLAPLFASYLFALLVILLTKKHKSLAWMLIPLFVTFFTGLGSTTIVPIFSIGSIANESFNFFLGIFFMAFLEKFDGWRNAVKIPMRLVGLAVSVLFLYVFYSHHAVSPLGDGEMIGSLFCWIPLITCFYGLRVNILFDNVVFKKLGGVSFHMYVWHYVVYRAWCIHFLRRGLPVYEGDVKALVIYLVIVMAVSVLSFCACELWHKFKVTKKIADFCRKKPTSAEGGG